MGTFEEEYMGVLQNLEFALAQTYRQYDEMTDWEALNGVNGLIRTYTAEQRKRKPPNLKLSVPAQAAYDNVAAMCDWRLGRSDMVTDEGEPVNLSEMMAPMTVSEIIACLKRIRKSIQLWQKEGGRRGYFEFVSQFLP